MLSLLNNSNRTERILLTIKALGLSDLAITKVDEEPEYIYVKDDIKLNDAFEVIKYISSNSPLYGAEGSEKKELSNEWLRFCKEELEVPVSVLTWLANGFLTREAVPVLAEKKARSDVMLLLRKIEMRLKESPFLTGEEMGIADIVVASCLRPLFMLVFGETERKNNQCMCAWIEKMYTSSIFLETVGETSLLVSAKKGKK